MPAACRSSSRRQQRIVVNCGLPLANRESWRQVARATAAHSTVTFNDTSSCRFREDGRVPPDARRCRWSTVRAGRVARSEHGDTLVLRTSHDGYARRFNVIHHRAIMLTRATASSTARTCSCRRMATSLPPARATSSRSAFTCIRRSRPAGWPTGRRHAGAAEQGCLDLQRLRGPASKSRRASISPAPTGRAGRCRS